MPKGQQSGQPGAVEAAPAAWATRVLAGLVSGMTVVPALAADADSAAVPAAGASIFSQPLFLAIALLVGAGMLAVLKRRFRAGKSIDVTETHTESRVAAPAGESIADVLAATPAVLRPARPVSRARPIESHEDEDAEAPPSQTPRRRHAADRLLEVEEPQPGAPGNGRARALLIQALALSENVLAGPAALDFARRLARGGRVIFIDIEGETLPPGPGLAELIGGEVTFADAIGRDDNSRLHLIGRGEDTLEEGGSFELMVDALRETYDFVVLAGETSDDGTVIAAIDAADGAILVRGPATPESRVRAEMDDLRAAGVRDVFVVEADEKSILEAA